MPYINAQQVSEKRKALKKALPEFKFSVVRDGYSGIRVAILSGNIDLLPDSENKYEQVNHFHIENFYSNYPETKSILLKVNDILNHNNYTESYDYDYGSIPSFYVSLNIGKWNQPYEIK
jgi:hypothetical protein